MCLLLSLIAVPVSAEEVVDHSTYGALLETYVDAEGRVDYSGWADDEEAREKLDDYLETVGEASVEGHNDHEKLAFYLNAYNALVLDAMLEAWPTDSPQSIEGFFEETTHRVAGQSMTLDHLEHGLIREQFDEARIHFVLVCAARSCPPLRREPLTGATLDSTLEEATSTFIASTTELDEETIVASRLFKWFAEDFEEAAGSVPAYIAQYVEGDLEEALEDDETEITYRSYDWSVNAQ